MSSEFVFETYPKITGPFKRFTEGAQKNQLDRTRWTNPNFEVLRDKEWWFTEKIDGTNIRVGWDGYRVRFGGRTDRAETPGDLLATLEEMFPEELMEQQFGATPAILFGEGYGAKIQKVGGNYRQDKSFVLFDVKIGKFWLQPGDVYDIRHALGIDAVPGKVQTLDEAIETVETGLTSSWAEKEMFAEGLVGVPMSGMLNRDGSRIQVKVKHADFFKGDSNEG